MSLSAIAWEVIKRNEEKAENLEAELTEARARIAELEEALWVAGGMVGPPPEAIAERGGL